MQINVNGDIEKIIQSAMSSGRFGSVEECVEAMAHCWRNHQPEFTSMPDRTDIDELASQANVPPFRAHDTVPADLWPPDEAADGFLQFVRDCRDETPREGQAS